LTKVFINKFLAVERKRPIDFPGFELNNTYRKEQ